MAGGIVGVELHQDVVEVLTLAIAHESAMGLLQEFSPDAVEHYL
jgi:hypothetical protein